MDLSKVSIRTIEQQLVRFPLPPTGVSNKISDYIEFVIQDGNILIARSVGVNPDGTEDSAELRPTYSISSAEFFKMVTAALKMVTQDVDG